MADEWIVTTTPCDAHRAWQSRPGHFLDSAEWAVVLQSLGARVHYAWNERSARGALVPVFRRGGVRAGILGFPVAGSHWDACFADVLRQLASSIARQACLQILRLNLCRQGAAERGVSGVRPNHWVMDLQACFPEHSKTLRRDIAFATRSATRHGLVEVPPSGVALHALYAGTVLSRHGRVRYSEAYFDALARAAAGSSGLDVFSHGLPTGDILGFAVLAVHDGVGYYLHAAAAEQGRRMGLSDLLLQRLVTRARESGCHTLDLMASPWEQPGLLRFKRKWSSHNGFAVTYDCTRGIVGRLAGWVARRAGEADRQRARMWRCESYRDNAGTS